MYKLPKPPYAGGGLHSWILQSSRYLILAGQTAERVHATLFDLCEDKGRESKHLSKEIWDAIDGVVKWMDAEGVEVDPNTRSSIKLYRSYKGDGFGLSSDRLDRRDNRPDYLETDSAMQAEVLGRFQNIKLDKYIDTAANFDYDDLFDLDWNICLCQTVEMPVVRPFSFWAKQVVWESYQFTIPSGLVKCGEGGSVKCDANMYKRLYQVIEFDKVESIDDQFRLLWFLGIMGKLTRLGMVVFSGNKSLHGWFPCFHMTPRQIKTFLLTATQLGADPMLRIPSQYVRLPNGWNYKHSRRQEVLFWNQEIIEFHNEYVRNEVL